MTRMRMFADDAVMFRFNAQRNVWEAASLLRRRRWLRVLTASALVILIGLILKGVGLIFLYAAHPQLDLQSRRFAERAVDDLDVDWNENALFVRASPAFSVNRSPLVDAQFSELQGIGPGQRSEDCVGSSSIDPGALLSQVTASYACAIHLNSMPAVVVLSMAREAGSWKIVGIYVSTPLRP